VKKVVEVITVGRAQRGRRAAVGGARREAELRRQAGVRSRGYRALSRSPHLSPPLRLVPYSSKASTDSATSPVARLQREGRRSSAAFNDGGALPPSRIHELVGADPEAQARVRVL
jgi:hypothetical protein